jgi:hypothetical protein
MSGLRLKKRRKCEYIVLFEAPKKDPGGQMQIYFYSSDSIFITEQFVYSPVTIREITYTAKARYV